MRYTGRVLVRSVPAILLLLVAAMQALPINALPATASTEAARLRLEGYILAIGPDKWRISDQTVLVDTETVLIQDEGAAEVGAWVMAWLTRTSEGALHADSIEVIWPASHVGQEIQFSGVFTKLYGTMWGVSGTSFVVDDNTRISGDPVIGSLLRVVAEQHSPLLHALTVEVIADTPGAVPVEFEGTIDSISPTLWVIDGSNVELDDHTYRQGQAQVGAHAEVRALLREDLPLLARWINVTNQPLPEMKGALVTGIVPAEAGAQTWEVLVFSDEAGSDPLPMSFTVDATTLVDESRAVARPGRWADLQVQRLDDGSYDVKTIRLEKPVPVSVKGQVSCLTKCGNGWWQVDGRVIWAAQGTVESVSVGAAGGDSSSGVEGVLLGNGVIMARRLRAAIPLPGQ